MVCVRDDPWSGKSDAISTSGSPSPSYSIAVHELDGSASTLPPVPPEASVVAPPPSPDASSSSPPQPAASNASTATSRARTLSTPRFLEINCSPPPSPVGPLPDEVLHARPQPLFWANGAVSRLARREINLEASRYACLTPAGREPEPSCASLVPRRKYHPPGPKWRNWQTRRTQNPV